MDNKEHGKEEIKCTCYKKENKCLIHDFCINSALCECKKCMLREADGDYMEYYDLPW